MRKLSLWVGLIFLGWSSAGWAGMIAQFTFEPGYELVDRTGNFGDLSLMGNAAIVGGKLDVNGSGTTSTGWAVSGAYTGAASIGNKTLVSWLTLQSLEGDRTFKLHSGTTSEYGRYVKYPGGAP